MSGRRILRSEVWETETIYTRARIVRDRDGAALGPSDCTHYRVRMYDTAEYSAPGTLVYDYGPAAASEVLSYSYRTSGWDIDSTGYNFQYARTSESPSRYGGHYLRTEIEIGTVCEGMVGLVHLTHLKPTWGSGS